MLLLSSMLVRYTNAIWFARVATQYVSKMVVRVAMQYGSKVLVRVATTVFQLPCVLDLVSLLAQCIAPSGCAVKI